MKYILATALALVIVACSPVSDAAPIDPALQPQSIVNCVLPTEREDDTAFDFATERSPGNGVVWYYGFSSGQYTMMETTTSCQWIIDNAPLVGKTIYFVVTVKDDMGRESVYSSPENIHTVGGVVGNPKSPTNFTIDSPISQQPAN